MESTEDRGGDDASVLGKLVSMLCQRSRNLGRGLRDTGSERCVGASSVVEVFEAEEWSTKMVFGKWNQEVDALAAKGSDESLAKGVCLGGARWRAEDPDAEMLDRVDDFVREEDVPVENHVWPVVRKKSVWHEK